MQRRILAAVGDNLSGLSDAQSRANRLKEMLDGGLPRLDDQTLVHRIQIYTTALNASDKATCAATQGVDAESRTVQTLLSLLDSSLYGQWAEIDVEAIEAQAKGSPTTRTLSQADIDGMYHALFARMSATDKATYDAIGNGAVVPDAARCALNRAFYVRGLGLDPKNLATRALADVTP